MCAPIRIGMVVHKRQIHPGQLLSGTPVQYTNMNRGCLREKSDRSNRKQNAREYG